MTQTILLNELPLLFLDSLKRNWTLFATKLDTTKSTATSIVANTATLSEQDTYQLNVQSF